MRTIDPHDRRRAWLAVIVAIHFIGKAWQYLRWDSPLQALAREQVVIDRWEIGLGILFAIGAFSAIWTAINPLRWHVVVYFFATITLIVETFVSWQAHNWEIANLLEHTLLWSIPIFLFLIMLRPPSEKVMLAMKIAIAATFIGHGMYALGVYGVPDHFIGMTRGILGLSEEGAKVFLKIMGVLDFVAAIGLFWKGSENYVVWYLVAWGFLTALARMVANIETDAIATGLDRWTWETLIRIVHGGLPLWLWWVMKEERELQPQLQ